MSFFVFLYSFNIINLFSYAQHFQETQQNRTHLHLKVDITRNALYIQIQ